MFKSYFLPVLQIYYLPFDNVFQKPSIYFSKLVINITVSHIFAILMKLFISTKNREVNDLWCLVSLAISNGEQESNTCMCFRKCVYSNTTISFEVLIVRKLAKVRNVPLLSLISCIFGNRHGHANSGELFKWTWTKCQNPDPKTTLGLPDFQTIPIPSFFLKSHLQLSHYRLILEIFCWKKNIY